MNANKYYIAGNRGLVGSWYDKYLGYPDGGNSSVVDYADNKQTMEHITDSLPTHIILNAASVGGLQEDLDREYELLMKNLSIQNNIMCAATKNNVERLLLQGSACSYPEDATMPFTEIQLMCGKIYDGYITTALPKLIGMHQCRSSNRQFKTKWRTAINTNMFGPNDRSGEYAHVVGALMSKFVKAIKNDYTTIEVWGDGSQIRDLLYIEDAISAMDLVLNNDKYDTVNISSGYGISVRELVDMLCNISGFTGKIWFNENRLTGSKSRILDNSRLKSLGWYPRFDLLESLEITYRWYYDNTR